MKVVFAGTPDFADLSLQAIINGGFQVVACLTQPDRPSGRGMKLTPSPVKQTALANDITVLQPQSLRLDGKYPDQAKQAYDFLSDLQPDVIVVAAYGLLLPQWVLDLPQYGCLNIHASLLPRWRGAAPIQRAIEAGDKKTGITIMQMDAGLDTGAMLLRVEREITINDTAQSLHDALAIDGAAAILDVLHKLSSGKILRAQAQPEHGISYAKKLSKSESALDLSNSAEQLALRIRAFNPFPGNTVLLPGINKPVKVWQACVLKENNYPVAAPGSVLSADKNGIDLATGDGVLRILELQKPGGRRQNVADFIQGWQR